MRDEDGFSLIELLIVVAIILVIAAIAIPQFLRSREAANEASAVSSIRTIVTAQTTYASAYPTVGFADSLTKLGAPSGGGAVGPNNAGLIDWVLGCASQPCPKSGYQFAVANPVGTPVTDYELTGVPIVVGQTGRRGFCSDQRATIRVDSNGGTACTATL
jgi:type IV pilus assembly protein PilA